MSRPGVGDDDVLVVAVVVDDGGHGLPRVLDVVEVAPQVARADDRGVVGLQRITKPFVFFATVIFRACPKDFAMVVLIAVNFAVGRRAESQNAPGSNFAHTSTGNLQLIEKRCLIFMIAPQNHEMPGTANLK